MTSERTAVKQHKHADTRVYAKLEGDTHRAGGEQKKEREDTISQRIATRRGRNGEKNEAAEEENLQTTSGHHSGDAGAVLQGVGVTPQCGVAICRLALRVSPSVAPPPRRRLYL